MVAAQIALRTRARNRFGTWTGTQGSEHPPAEPEMGGARIHSGFCRAYSAYDGPRLSLADPVFTMGSCFARELEAALIQRGGNVVSTDATALAIPAFSDGAGRTRAGFFHRFTPRAMAFEFATAFGEIEGWNDEALIFERDGAYSDLNYWAVPGADQSLEATLARRRVAQELVRRAARAKVIVLTLGLIEAWRHKPTGFEVNRIDPGIVARRPDEFEFDVLSDADVSGSLEDILAILERHHETGDFRLVVTVSPVPLQKTFTDEDILVANATSKARLRNAAATFVGRHHKAAYFPSYEMVTLSNPEVAWRPDRVHVQPRMVKQIMAAFAEDFFAA